MHPQNASLNVQEGCNNASLLNVLRSKRVSNTIIRWINSMFSSRIARANSGEMNLKVHLLRGFPQGGGLSALMWILVADGFLLIKLC